MEMNLTLQPRLHCVLTPSWVRGWVGVMTMRTAREAAVSSHVQALPINT